MQNFVVRKQSNSRLELLARQKRSALTPSEQTLFNALRGGRIGVTVRRQVVIAPFIVDFLVPSKKLVIEVDGGWHKGREKADARRDRKLRRLGYRVVRIDAELVKSNIDQAVALVVAALEAP